MNLIKSLATAVAASAAVGALAQSNAPLPAITVQADKIMAKMPPTFYGLMTEEINYSYEGGLYGELVRNRSFKADAIPEIIKPENYDPAKYYPAKFPADTAPKFWSAINGTITLDTNTPLNEALNVSLKLDASKASKNQPAGIANDGYWGIPVQPDTTYHVSFYAKAKKATGPLTVSLVHVPGTNEVTVKVHALENKGGSAAKGKDGAAIGFDWYLGQPPAKGKDGSGKEFDWYLGQVQIPLASATVPKISKDWQKYELTLAVSNFPANALAGALLPSKNNRLVITTAKPGTIWFQQVSLTGPTYKDRPNGDRKDISQLLADARPKFLRLPGGNYVEGDYFTERFNWKQMVGPVEQRPGHRSCWGYWSTDGFGLPEFLGWCQDIGMEPVLAVFAGYTLRHDYIPAGDKLAPYVQEALDEIEYVTGDASTKWGAQRIKDGYPNPFPLHYVEIGNEDWFDKSGSYDGRFAQFYDAIKAKYPQLKCISTAPVKSRVADLDDEHYYRSEEEMESQSFMYDSRDRAAKTKIFVGEWATRVGSPTPNMAGALGDAAWMCCLERNADIVLMHCYAPLFVNVSQPNGGGKSMQWASDLIGYDALTSYGSPSYYAQKLFSLHTGDEVLGTSAENLPTYAWQPPAKKKNGVEQPPPPARQVKSLFYSATRDSATGKIFVKVVNRADTPQEVKVEIAGVSSVADTGTASVLKAANRDETNSLNDPQHVVPVTEKISGLGTSFTRTFPPCSITVLELDAK